MSRFPKELREEYILLIKKAMAGEMLTNREHIMLVYFQQRIEEREFKFVPKKLREAWCKGCQN